MYGLRVPRPEPGRRGAAPAQHAPQHQQLGAAPTSPRRGRPLRHRQPGQLVHECGHQAREEYDVFQ